MDWSISFVVLGALVSCLTTLFSNPVKPTHSLQERRFRIGIVIAAFVGVLSSVGGAYWAQSEKAKDKEAAAAALRASEAHAGELEKQLTNLRIDLGVDQLDMAKSVCPKPSATLKGHGNGLNYIVWRYSALAGLEIWFDDPSGRYAFSQYPNHRIPTREAAGVLPCISKLVILPKKSYGPPTINEQVARQPASPPKSPSDDGTALIWGVVIIIGIAFVFRGRGSNK